MKPDYKDFAICLGGGQYFNPETEDWEYGGESDFELVETQTDADDYPYGSVDRMIIIRHKETGELWGTECVHDSWNEEAYPGDGGQHIGRVEKQDVVYEEWVYVD